MVWRTRGLLPKKRSRESPGSLFIQFRLSLTPWNGSYSTEHKYEGWSKSSRKNALIEKLTATAQQPFYNVLLFSRALCIVWNLVRRRVPRRLTRLQTMYNVLKYSKTWWENDDISIYRYRTGTGNKFNLIMRMIVTVVNMFFSSKRHLFQITSHMFTGRRSNNITYTTTDSFLMEISQFISTNRMLFAGISIKSGN